MNTLIRYDKKVMAQYNRMKVLQIIRKEGPINKAEIAKRANLSIPTVMKITDEILRKDVIRVVGKGESNGGKRPELLEIADGTYYLAGIDIGRSRTTVLIMDLKGAVILKRVMKTGNTNPMEQLMERVLKLTEWVIEESGIDLTRILGLGVVTPGLIDIEEGKVVYSPDFGWENVDILTPIKEKFPLPILLDNSNKAVAMGEKWFGVAKDSSYFVCINMGHGIGSAIMENGELYRGNSGSSGEIGHITLEPNGPICECGNRGCLEALASGKAIAEAGRLAVREGRSSLILEKAEFDLDAIDAKEVFDAAREGDCAAIMIIQKAEQYIGIGLASYINLLDPDMLVLAGGLTNAGPQFIDNIKTIVKDRQMRFAGRKVKIRVAELGELAAAIGAASMILKRFIEEGDLALKAEC